MASINSTQSPELRMPRRSSSEVRICTRDGASAVGLHPIAAGRPIMYLCSAKGEKAMSLGTILLIVLIVFLVGALPTWPHSRNWGYYPSGGLGLVVLILLILGVMGRI